MSRELDENGFPVIASAALREAVLELCGAIREAKARGQAVHLWIWAQRAAVRHGVAVRDVLAKLRQRQAAGQRKAAARRMMEEK